MKLFYFLMSTRKAYTEKSVILHENYIYFFFCCNCSVIHMMLYDAVTLSKLTTPPFGTIVLKVHTWFLDP